MTTITNPSLFSGQYYQLPGQSGTGADTTSTGTSGAQNTEAALLQAIDQQAGGSSASSPTGAYMLNLSPQAQSYLSGLSSGNTSSSIGGASSLSGGKGFVLTPQQQQTINGIIAKYKDAPYTQATFQSIQNDLKAAGLSPDQLSLEDELRNFNPTNMLLDALNGGNPSNDVMSFGNNSTEQANAGSYMQQIMQQWQNMSSTADAASGVTGAGSTSL